MSKNSSENILNQILWDYAYLQKRIISDSIKTLQTKLLLARQMFNKLTKILLSWQKKFNVKDFFSFQEGVTHKSKTILNVDPASMSWPTLTLT